MGASKEEEMEMELLNLQADKMWLEDERFGLLNEVANLENEKAELVAKVAMYESLGLRVLSES